MAQIKINVGELRKLLRESSTEFKAKLGQNVEADNKRNNEKSYKEAEKRAKDYDGGLGEVKKDELPEKYDANRTTLDYNPRTEPDKEYKDKVELETHDERNIQMAHKAGDMTMRFSVFALCISEIFFFIFKMQTVGYVIGIIICAMCILYYGLYLYYKFKK